MLLLLSIVAIVIAVNAGLYLRARRLAAPDVCPEERDEPLPPFTAATAFAIECAATAAAAALLPLHWSLPTRLGRRTKSIRVVLVHGATAHRGVLWPLTRTLVARGYEVVFERYPLWWGDVPRAADWLHDRLHVLQREQSGPLCVIGCGAGGLAARLCARRMHLPGWRHIVTIGTPHQGTRTVPARATGLSRLHPDSALMRHLAAGDRVPEQFDVVAIQSDFDAGVAPSGLGYYPGAFNIRVRDSGHFALFFSRRTADLVLENLPGA